MKKVRHEKNIEIHGLCLDYVFPLSNDAKNEMNARGKKADPADNDSFFLCGGLTVSMSF